MSGILAGFLVQPAGTDSLGAAEAGPTQPGHGGHGIEELALADLFRRPIGPKGLEYSAKARALDGRRVRVTGHQVRQTAPIPYSLLLAPVPVKLHEREYGLAEDLPVNTVHVFFPRNPTPVTPWMPGLQTVEGTLSLGAREEADGRISHVRLEVTAPPAGEVPKGGGEVAGTVTNTTANPGRSVAVVP